MARIITDHKTREGAGLGDSLSEPTIGLEKRPSGSDSHHDADPTLESYAAIMATNRPDPRGPGYIKLYILAGTMFLCSTMSG